MAMGLQKSAEDGREPATLLRLLETLTACAVRVADEARERFPVDRPACQELAAWMVSLTEQLARRLGERKPEPPRPPGKMYPIEELLTVLDLCTAAERAELEAGRWVPCSRRGSEWRRLKEECTPAEWRAILQGAPDPERLEPMPGELEALVMAWWALVDLPRRERTQMAERWASRLPEGVKMLLRHRQPWALLGLTKEGGKAK